MNNIRVLFFATLKALTGVSETVLELPSGTTVEELKEHLGVVFPAAAPSIATAIVSVNQEYMFGSEVVPTDAEVAVFPPVSGGGNLPTLAEITELPIDLNVLTMAVTLPVTGAVCIFTGTVRALTKRGHVHDTMRLEYEAYKPMAEAKMRQIADEIRAKWRNVEGVALVQRIGTLEPGAISVAIVCSSAHRDCGVFEAARYGIDRLKEIVPIWKKEVTTNGESWVEGTYLPKPGE